MKKVICVMMAIILAASFFGCGRETGEEYFTSSERFIIVSGHNPNAPYYETMLADKDTGVLYLIVYRGYHFAITPLLDADGKPLLLEE